MLHILVNIQSETEFNEVLRKFLDRYKQVEPAFIQYFEDNYSSRNGNMLLTIIIALHYYATEKWAMCFRKFEHSDTDTNMHIERFVNSITINVPLVI